MLNPHIASQLGYEHRRDMLTDGQRQSLARQFSAEPGAAQLLQQLTQRLRRRLRAVTRPRPAAQA